MVPEKNVTIEVNANFHHILGDDLFQKNEVNFKRYRREWSEWPRNFYTGLFPLFIDIEVTNACNLKCHFCATTFHRGKADEGFISFDMVKKIVDEGASRRLYGVKFNIRGEPLLHPRIASFVEYAKKKGLIDVYFNTNATLLDNKMADKLIRAGLDRISISFEGHTKKIYEAHRIGAEYEGVVRNVEYIQLLKRKLNVYHPRVRVQTVLLPQIKTVFEEYRKFWSGRADEVAFLDYKNMKMKRRGVKHPWACPQLWQRMAVLWDGTILPCNHDDDCLNALGNISNMTIEEAWHSRKLDHIRKAHKKGAGHDIPACDGCYLRDSEIAKLKNKKEKERK